ncbi:MAG: hypothetical protein J7M34_03735 [Anaerolineae bacterium]|nr:hypothetical protein [Anaerolineae bacterium]
METRLGNSVRRSRAADEAQVLNNLPGLYPTEDWNVVYWTVDAQGNLHQRQVIIQLPAGLADLCIPVPIGYNGCVQMVRRWGMAIYPSLLEDIGFDLEFVVRNAPERYGNASGDYLRAALDVTHFDLPGFFVIASDEHPLLMYAPDGTLKGSYTRWRTYLGALAYLATQGQVNSGFLRLAREARATYQAAVEYLQEALMHQRL